MIERDTIALYTTFIQLSIFDISYIIEQIKYLFPISPHISFFPNAYN